MSIDASTFMPFFVFLATAAAPYVRRRRVDARTAAERTAIGVHLALAALAGIFWQVSLLIGTVILASMLLASTAAALIEHTVYRAYGRTPRRLSELFRLG